MKNGYIAMHRKMLDNPLVCKDAEHFAVWSYLLLNATHTNQKKIFAGKTITLEPGMLITGRKKIATFFKISESKVQRILKAFESEHQIEQQTCNQNRLITVLNWTLYQINEHQSEQQVNNKRTTSEQRVNNERTTSEQRVNTNNNVNKEDKVKNEKKVDKVDNEGDTVAIAEKKHKHGKYNNVLLTESEVEKLKNDLGYDYQDMIDEFSEGIKIKNYGYKDHNLAIRRWYRKRQDGNKKTGHAGRIERTMEVLREFVAEGEDEET